MTKPVPFKEFVPQLPAVIRETKVKLTVTKAAVDIAQQMRDWEKLHIAIEEMIDIQRDFVEWWDKAVGSKHGGDRSKIADQLSCSAETAEKATGIAPWQVSRWRKSFKHLDAYRKALFEHEYRKAMALRGTTDQRGASGTGDNEWFTPAEHIELARAVLGEIDLDPATHAKAQKIVKAKTFLTKADNGLACEWHGRVWLNPPYAQPAIAEFVSKMCAERLANRVSAAIMLTHNYTDTAWFYEAASVADAICFTRGRVKFYEPGGAIAQPTQGQAFFYFGDKVELFTTHFQPIGFVVVPV